MKILILNGPNLNLLGKREPEIYGNQTFEGYFQDLIAKYSNLTLEYYQSNHEGALLDKLHEVGFDYQGIVLNAGAYTHTSIALSDAVKAISTPVVEVHISDVMQRETFRHHSFLTPVCAADFVGHGLNGYDMAIDFLLK
jgi:3-dehydroquinate dehydratase-2